MSATDFMGLKHLQQLSGRERVLLLLVLLAVNYALWDVIFIQPLARQQQRLSKRIAFDEVRLDKLTADISEQQKLPQIDVENDQLAQLARLLDEYAEQGSHFMRLETQLLSPPQLAEVLDTILQQNTELHLLSLQTLPPQRVIAEPTLDNSLAGDLLTQGLVLRFEGDYLAGLRYLQQLENLPWRLYWDKLHISVQEYPQTLVSIHVYTYSLVDEV